MSTATILKMQTLSRKNFNKFGGYAWKPSGAILDNLLAAHVESLPYESALHSFVIEDVKGVLQLAMDEKDRALLRTKLVDRPKEQPAALSEPEKAFLKKYNLLPDDCGTYWPPGGVHFHASGHKADGMVITKLSSFELCTIEAAKKDSAPRRSTIRAS
ncbi:hypothetical protein BGZ65_009001, partial [Modicella reniformis]